jgi:hypothetical protein
VEGYGMPALGALEVEGVDAEVERVVELVRELRDTGEIAVVSLSPVTAERIAAALRADRELAPLLAGARVVVCDLESAADLARDTVILSVGYAKTPHGRVLHRFGAVSSPEGLALMIDALDCVRQNLHIVSCFGPAALDRQRLQHPGARLLADLLDFASDSPAEPGSSKARSQPAEGEPDRLLMDLAAPSATRIVPASCSSRSSPTTRPTWRSRRCGVGSATGWSGSRSTAGCRTWRSRPPCSWTRCVRPPRSRRRSARPWPSIPLLSPPPLWRPGPAGRRLPPPP